MRMVFAALAPPPEEETPKGQSMTNNQTHYDLAALILNRTHASTDDLLRAVAHAVLAGYRPPLHIDAFAPHSAAEASELSAEGTTIESRPAAN